MTEPRVVPLDFLSPDPRTISRAAKLLTDGELVVAPTETRYGLLGRADLPDVLERIYRIKGRAAKQPMAIFVRSVPMILHYASVPSSAERLARRFLPGPLTLVLKRLPGCDCPVVYKGKIGVRVSSAPFIRQLLECVTFPLTATSANLSGRGCRQRKGDA
ncbi:MAG TPA: L-threonylcarbamoyladenylate synthase, partial [Candidatus Deferrimicrobium sp.]|nr:L-threonylcarbamoyladenylate synthase [Candidatus Deferrimicrobium sp.]